MCLTERTVRPFQLSGGISQILLLISFYFVCSGVQAQLPVAKIRDLINKVNIDTLSRYVRCLSGEDSVRVGSGKYLISSRRPGGNSHVVAGDYIRSRLSGYGLTTYEQYFSTVVSGRNIYAVQPGKNPDVVYVICAHYDAVREFAADDNATGVAAVLETARILSSMPLEYTVIYGLWDQEETGLNGSKYFAGWSFTNHMDIRGVINLDMLGWDGNSDDRAEIHTRNYANSVEMASDLEKLNADFMTGLNTPVINPGTTSSDQASFWNYNYPAILLIEAYTGGDFNPYYHTVLDRFSALNLPYYNRMVKLAVTGISSYVIGNTSVRTIDLKAGWNIFSTNILPDNPDMKFLFTSLIGSGTLLKIQDESGNSLENYGILGGWVNNIGDISLTEGYKIKVSNDCQIIMEGKPASLPLKIPLKTGWNMVGFPLASEEDGMEIIRQLIDRRTLVKVQDETGNSLEDWGVFGGWVNNIGNFKPGKGYKIKVNSSDTLSIYAYYPKSAILSGADRVNTVHFSPVASGKGVDHMNINLVDLPSDLLQPGDEIAVFDDGRCVGSVSLLSHHLSNGRVSIPVSASDDEGWQGFSNGDPFSLKYWIASDNKEISLEAEILKGTATFLKNETTLARPGKFISGFNNIYASENIEFKIFPNPTNGKVTISAGIFSTRGLNVELMNSTGQLVRSIFLGTNPGMVDLSGNPAGIYLLRISHESGTQTHKVLLK